jgi:hypothetical protein
MEYVCRICGLRFPSHHDETFQRHVGRCAERNADVVDAFRPAVMEFGDPELAAFAREEGSVYNRRAGTRRRPH